MINVIKRLDEQQGTIASMKQEIQNIKIHNRKMNNCMTDIYNRISVLSDSLGEIKRILMSYGNEVMVINTTVQKQNCEIVTIKS